MLAPPAHNLPSPTMNPSYAGGQARRLRCDLTFPALNSDLEKMAAYMDRVGLDCHAASFRVSLAVSWPAMAVMATARRSDHHGACRLV